MPAVSPVREVVLPAAEEDEVTLEAWHREPAADPLVTTPASAPTMILAALKTPETEVMGPESTAPLIPMPDLTLPGQGEVEELESPVSAPEPVETDPVPVLLAALSRTPGDASTLLRRLGRYGDPRGLVAVAGWLFAGAPSERRAAAEALRSMPAETAIGPLAGALHDPDPGVREIAVSSLGALLTTGAMHLLVDRLADPDYTVREAAIMSLGKAGPVALEALVEALGHPDREVRAGAAQVLRESGWSASDESEALGFALASEDWRTLARFGESVLGPLSSLLVHPDPDLRLGAVIALGAIGGDRATDLIRQAYADPSPLVRNRAALLLHERKTEETPG